MSIVFVLFGLILGCSLSLIRELDKLDSYCEKKRDKQGKKPLRLEFFLDNIKKQGKGYSTRNFGTNKRGFKRANRDLIFSNIWWFKRTEQAQMFKKLSNCVRFVVLSVQIFQTVLHRPQRRQNRFYFFQKTTFLFARLARQGVFVWVLKNFSCFRHSGGAK